MTGKCYTLQPHQKFRMANIFGWKRISDNYRRFREVFISEGRGNGKSPQAALILSTATFFDQPYEHRSENVIAATKKDQTKFVYNELTRQIKRQPCLMDRCEILKDTIRFSDDGWITRLSANGSSEDGAGLHVAVMDEIHAWKEAHRELFDKITTGMGKRDQPLVVYITTAGSERSRIWLEVYRRARKVLTGDGPNDRMFVSIHEIDDNDEPTDPRVWPKANPMLGITVKEEELRGMANDAKEDRSVWAKLKRYYCNKMTFSLNKWMSPEIWALGNNPLPPLGSKALCYLGLDIGFSDDLAALAAIFPFDRDGVKRYGLKAWCWTPQDGARHHKLTTDPWATWINRGLLEVTPGNVTDHHAILDRIALLQSAYTVPSIAIDPNNARTIGIDLKERFHLDVFEFWQNTSRYNEPMLVFKNELKKGNIFHGGNEIMRWSFSNLIAHEDREGKSKPDRRYSEEKIDLCCAMFMAMNEAAVYKRADNTPLAPPSEVTIINLDEIELDNEW